jgi:aromatic ring-opening dioxygenase catalytic subunit (LigB family)
MRIDHDDRRVPVVFLPHGGGPWPFVDLGMDKNDLAELAAYLRMVPTVPKTQPTAILIVSAHWEGSVPTVMTAERPPLLYDYYGFPPAAYEIKWPAPGDPKLAARVQQLLDGAGFKSAIDSRRGYDHGTFVPLKVAYPEANVPTVQLSLLSSLDPEEHLAMGRALSPLRDEGVFIVGSGMSFHNLRALGDPRAGAASETFDAWLRETATQGREDRDRRLAQWAHAPEARTAHPREEHLLPLMVVAGAAGDDRGKVGFRGAFMGTRISSYHYGG